MGEPDWTQRDATQEEVKAWMRERKEFTSEPNALAYAAFNHFARPYHINVMRKLAEEILAESNK